MVEPECCSDDDMLLDELDLSEEEGKDAEAVKKREARKRLKMEAEVASCSSMICVTIVATWHSSERKLLFT